MSTLTHVVLFAITSNAARNLFGKFKWAQDNPKYLVDSCLDFKRQLVTYFSKKAVFSI